jgi:hypothetical protein
MSEQHKDLTRRERIALWLILLALDIISPCRWSHKWDAMAKDIREELRK